MAHKQKVKDLESEHTQLAATLADLESAKKDPAKGIEARHAALVPDLDPHPHPHPDWILAVMHLIGRPSVPW